MAPRALSAVQRQILTVHEDLAELELRGVVAHAAALVALVESLRNEPGPVPGGRRCPVARLRFAVGDVRTSVRRLRRALAEVADAVDCPLPAPALDAWLRRQLATLERTEG